MRIGMKVVPEHYVHNDGHKIVSVSFKQFFFTAVAITSTCAALKVGIQSLAQ